jgi:hypothetical protein
MIPVDKVAVDGRNLPRPFVTLGRKPPLGAVKGTCE